MTGMTEYDFHSGYDFRHKDIKRGEHCQARQKQTGRKASEPGK